MSPYEVLGERKEHWRLFTLTLAAGLRPLLSQDSLFNRVQVHRAHTCKWPASSEQPFASERPAEELVWSKGRRSQELGHELAWKARAALACHGLARRVLRVPEECAASVFIHDSLVR